MNICEAHPNARYAFTTRKRIGAGLAPTYRAPRLAITGFAPGIAGLGSRAVTFSDLTLAGQGRFRHISGFSTNMLTAGSDHHADIILPRRLKQVPPPHPD